jgi:hypothetical protein
MREDYDPRGSVHSTERLHGDAVRRVARLQSRLSGCHNSLTHSHWTRATFTPPIAWWMASIARVEPARDSTHDEGLMHR